MEEMCLSKDLVALHTDSNATEDSKDLERFEHTVMDKNGAMAICQAVQVRLKY